MRIGVLALQGDVREHERALRALGAETVRVKRPAQLERIAGLVIPGGESPAIHRLLALEGLDARIAAHAALGMPVFGTCAGLILLARRIEDGSVPTLSLLDATVRRNGYGRQLESFETRLVHHTLGGEPLHAVFIRAPTILDTGDGISVLARHEGRPVAIEQGAVIGCAFHPALSGDLRLHARFLERAAAFLRL